jgi:hypothetical protein
MFGFNARAKRPLEPNKRKNKQEQARNKPDAAGGVHQIKSPAR